MTTFDVFIHAIIPLNLTLGLVSCGLIAKWYVWPRLRDLPARDALIPLIFPHAFRYLGLTFLIYGVTTKPLDPRFADPTAYGDLLTVVLALASIAALRANSPLGIALVWIFSVVGIADFTLAFPLALTLANPGDFGACIYIPMIVVPPLMVSHYLIIAKLLQGARNRAAS